ncbi:MULTISPECIES: hypothetical protein [Burkholderia cepacia complex]|uniref:hypothetical protein n=1 Tax=Burkholderia cenocepacia TaxID=95486 RepID=UPI002237D91C|nr:hypothetical protein [Burkholderia cenocepacia]MCW5156398.1 hypothetical protein [Burkholderia cenocepacia]
MFKRFMKDILRPEASLNDKVKQVREVPELSEETKKVFAAIESSEQATEQKVPSRYGIKQSR